jgi:aminomethyltransferase
LGFPQNDFPLKTENSQRNTFFLKTTPFISSHRASGAKLIDFGGYEMPVNYPAGIVKEHMAVRERAGMFDVSHMGEIEVTGAQALDLVQFVTTNDASVLFPGRVQYSAMCYEDGGIVDDLLVYMIAENHYLLVVNASNKDKDFAWIVQNNTFDATVTDISEQTCLLAVQGPQAIEKLQAFTDVDLASIPYYHFKIGTFMGMEDVILSATGYTGEAGLEIYFQHRVGAADPDTIWRTLLSAGIEPCGLGSRDSLRLEMGYALYGNDITASTTPLEAGLGWVTKLSKGRFLGSDVLTAQKAAGVQKKLVGFTLSVPRAIPRSHYRLGDATGAVIGEVSSGGQSIVKGIGIGMGYVDVAHASEGTKIFVEIRNQWVEAVVTRPPFIKKA